MSRQSIRSRLAVLGVAAAVLAGCSGAAPTTVPAATAAPPAANPAATAAPPATSAPASPTQAAAAVADLCVAAEASGGEPIAAGAYRFAGPGPAFTMTLPAGYGAACSGSTITLFGPAGSIVIVDGVAKVGPGGAVAAVEATIDAVGAAMTAAAAKVDGPHLDTIGDLEGTSLVVTTGDAGIVVKDSNDRGWAWSKEEADAALVTMVEVAPGMIVVAIRMGAGPGLTGDALRVGDDVMNSIVFE